MCKAGVSVENVIPVYARGADAVDPRCVRARDLLLDEVGEWLKRETRRVMNRRSQDVGDGGIPSRPRGQRPDAELLRRRRPRGGAFANPMDAPFVMFPTLAFFPALFGIPFVRALLVRPSIY